MKISLNLTEEVNGTKYSVQINSPDGENFSVFENGTKFTEYDSRVN